MKKKLSYVLGLVSVVSLTAGVINYGTSATAVNYGGQKQGKYLQNPSEEILVSDTATTTKSIPARYTHTLDSDFIGQGVCIRVKDKAGSGYTFLSTDKGVLSASLTSCE